MSTVIRVQVPFQLQRLANCPAELAIPLPPDESNAPVTQQHLIAALEHRYPPLRGAVIDPHTHERRPLLRFFACQEDHSFRGLDSALPEAVVAGREPFLIVGAISGG